MAARRLERPRPGQGGAEGYTPPHRTDAIQSASLGVQVTPSARSLRRWRNRPWRLAKSGGVAATNLRGHESVLLALYRLAWPKATLDQVRAFIARRTGRLYSRADVSLRESQLGLTRKVGSTTAWQAFTPMNLYRRQQFWSAPYPVGVAGTARAALIDVDEFAVTVDKCNARRGKAGRGIRVRQRGHYEKGDHYTGIIGVSPCGHVWFRLMHQAGMNGAEFLSFLLHIFANPPANAPAARTVLFDNLGCHTSPTIFNAVQAAGHRYVCRPPYRPCDGPVEYCIHQVEENLVKMAYVVNPGDRLGFEQAIFDCVSNITGIDETFVHCGY